MKRLFATWYFKFHIIRNIKFKACIMFIYVEKHIKFTLYTIIKCI